MCNCNDYTHRVTNITADTTLVNLSVTNNSNIGQLEPFQLVISRCKQVSVANNPLPVTITVNGTVMPLLDYNGIQVMSNKIPLRACGTCVLTAPEPVTSSVAETATERAITAPYIILQRYLRG